MTHKSFIMCIVLGAGMICFSASVPKSKHEHRISTKDRIQNLISVARQRKTLLLVNGQYAYNCVRLLLRRMKSHVA
jgi:hypothetical protein